MEPHESETRAITSRRWTLLCGVVVIALVAVLLGCGGSGNDEASPSYNDSVVNEAATTAKQEQSAEREVLSALHVKAYRGVENAFQLQSGDWCQISNVEVHDPSDQPVLPENTLVSPGGETWVVVYNVADAPLSECLKATQDALGW